jgi:hypothetical protein
MSGRSFYFLRVLESERERERERERETPPASITPQLAVAADHTA